MDLGAWFDVIAVLSEDEFAADRNPLIWSVREDGIDLLERFAESASCRLPSSTSDQKGR